MPEIQSKEEWEAYKAKREAKIAAEKDKLTNKLLEPHESFKLSFNYNQKAAQIKLKPIEIDLNNKKQMISIIGALILIFGVFSPIIQFPLIGNINYFQNGKGDGVIVLILGIISLYFSLTKEFDPLFYLGSGSLAMLIFTFLFFQSKLRDIHRFSEANSGGFFGGITGLMTQSIQLQWGWIFLIFGSLLLIAVKFLKTEKL